MVIQVRPCEMISARAAEIATSMISRVEKLALLNVVPMTAPFCLSVDFLRHQGEERVSIHRTGQLSARCRSARRLPFSSWLGMACISGHVLG